MDPLVIVIIVSVIVIGIIGLLTILFIRDIEKEVKSNDTYVNKQMETLLSMNKSIHTIADCAFKHSQNVQEQVRAVNEITNILQRMIHNVDESTSIKINHLVKESLNYRGYKKYKICNISKTVRLLFIYLPKDHLREMVQEYLSEYLASKHIENVKDKK